MLGHVLEDAEIRIAEYILHVRGAVFRAVVEHQHGVAREVVCVQRERIDAEATEIGEPVALAELDGCLLIRLDFLHLGRVVPNLLQDDLSSQVLGGGGGEVGGVGVVGGSGGEVGVGWWGGEWG